MGRLQPNFSWQKYQGNPEDQNEQFQKQLQTMHIVTANAINATINDLSYFLMERPTDFIWVDGTRIYTQTYATVAWTSTGTINTIPLGITGGKNGGFVVIDMVCCISNGTASTSTTLLIPHVDPSTSANEISIVRNGENIILTSGGTNRSSHSGYVTVYYTKN